MFFLNISLLSSFSLISVWFCKILVKEYCRKSCLQNVDEIDYREGAFEADVTLNYLIFWQPNSNLLSKEERCRSSNGQTSNWQTSNAKGTIEPYNTQREIFTGSTPQLRCTELQLKMRLAGLHLGTTEKGSSWAKHKVGCELTSVGRECSRQTSCLNKPNLIIGSLFEIRS